jgi:hypothetical protein
MLDKLRPDVEITVEVIANGCKRWGVARRAA